MDKSTLEHIEKSRLSIKLSINMIDKVLNDFSNIKFLEVKH